MAIAEAATPGDQKKEKEKPFEYFFLIFWRTRLQADLLERELVKSLSAYSLIKVYPKIQRATVGWLMMMWRA